MTGEASAALVSPVWALPYAHWPQTGTSETPSGCVWSSSVQGGLPWVPLAATSDQTNSELYITVESTQVTVNIF